MSRPAIDPLTVRCAEKLTAMGWTQYEIASELGVSNTTIRKSWFCLINKRGATSWWHKSKNT